MPTADRRGGGPCLSLRSVGKHFAPRRSLLEIAHLRAPAGLEVLAGASLEVEAGEVVCLMGQNGSGKTTLLRLSAGVLLPDSGRVSVLGGNPAASTSVRSRIGFLSSSERSFYWRLSARRNLLFWGSLQGLHGRRLRRAVADAASLTGCGDVLDRRFEDISTGMRQRVGLARAILHTPRLLLLDEPTRSMDGPAAASFVSTVRDLAEGGAAVLMSTHSPAEAGRLGDRTVRLEEGGLHPVDPASLEGPELAVSFRGTAPGSPPEGMSLQGRLLRCSAARLREALEWLESAGLEVTAVDSSRRDRP